MVSISDLLDQHDKEKEEPPKLTKKEKKQLKKLQKKLEREAKLRKAQEDDMDRETKVAQKNIVTYRAKWKEFGMEKARPEFKDFMEEHWSLFDHLMDRKDKLIELLTEELEHAERTRARDVADHINEVDGLIKDFYYNAEDIRAEMYQMKEMMLSDRNNKVQSFADESARVDENMRLIVYLVEQNKKKDYEVWGGELINLLDEEISKNRSENEIFIAQMKAQMVAFWKQFKIAFEEYIDESKRLFKLTEPLMEKMKADELIIQEDKVKIKALQTTLDILKSQPSPMSNELRDLRAERAELHEKYTKISKYRSETQQRHLTQLQWVITENKETTKYLGSIQAKGEKIIKFYEICRNLETKKEQYSPVRTDPHTRGIFIPYDRTNKMHKFWKRAGQVGNLASVVEIHHEKLKEKNNKLRQQLKRLLQSPQMHSILQDISHCLPQDY